MKQFIFYVSRDYKFISAISVMAETEEEALRIIHKNIVHQLPIIKGDTIQLKNTINMDERGNYNE